MAVELGHAYVSLVIEGKDVPRQVEGALKGAQPVVNSAGRSMGSTLAAGIGATMRTAAAGVGLAAGAVLGTALSAGFRRMTAIDDAKGKLAGLGHSAQSVSAIMESALASVKGTAFGLGDAATIAASAVAAGIKPGEELTRYLKLTADAATIAGTSLSDMGYVLNKVQTSGKAYTDDLNMLSDRGIPIFQWLREEYGKSADDLSKMVKEGKVDAATFQKVIRDNIGGAALESGKTLRGSWANLQAGLGRIGEGALAPFLPMMKSGLAAATQWADQVTPKVKAAAQNIANGLQDMGRAFQSNGASIQGTASNWEKLGIRARGVADRIKELWAAFQSGGLSEVWETLRSGGAQASEGLGRLQDSGTSLSGVLSRLRAVGADVGTTLLSLTGDTGTVVANTLRVLGSAMKFLADHSGVATAALIGFVAIQGVSELATVWGNIGRGLIGVFTPATLLATRAQTAALVEHTAVMRAYLVAIGGEPPVQAATLRARLAATAARVRETIATEAAASALGRYAVAQRAAVASSGLLVGGLRQVGATAAAAGARIQATATTALSGVGRAASGVTSVLGGPWVVAFAAAAAAVYKLHSEIKANEEHAKSYQAALRDIAVARRDLADVFADSGGVITDPAIDNLIGQVGIMKTSLDNAAESRAGFFEKNFVPPWMNDSRDKDWLADRWQGAKKLIDDLGMSDRQLAETLADTTKFEYVSERLRGMGQDGRFAVSELSALRDGFLRLQRASDGLTPGFNSLTKSIEVLSDKSATADQRVNALKRALEALSGKPVAVADAMQAYNRVLRDVADSTQTVWDKSRGFGEELIKDGQINTATENGDKLKKALDDIKSTTLEIASTGNPAALDQALAANQKSFEALATSTGLTVEQVNALAESINLVPREVRILATLQGDGPINQKLTAIMLALEAAQKTGQTGITVPIKEEGRQQVIAALEEAKAKVEEVTGQPGVFRITAPTADVLKELQQIINLKIPDKQFSIVENYTRIQRGIDDPEVRKRAPAYSPESGYTHYAIGGAVRGSGGPTSDSVPAMLSRDEHVWTAAEVEAAGGHKAVYGLRARALAGGFRFAKGGTPFGIQEAVSAAQAMEGHTYQWGGIGPNNFDCSGFVGFLQQVAMGLGRVVKRLYTTHTLLNGATAGLEAGLGPSGTLFQVGVSQEHMAATIAGRPVESGGALGTSGIGGTRAGASDAQFPYKFHLPNALIKGIDSMTTGGKVIEWNEEDELELLQLEEAVNQAQEKRDKVYADEKSTPSDRRKADLDVRAAQNKVVKKQEQRDKQGQIEGGNRVAPQAPALSKKYSDEEKSYASKLQAVEQANESRNSVYDDPESTDIDKQMADVKLQEAIEELETSGAKESANSPKSVKGILQTFASNVVGTVFDAFKEQLPNQISGSHWWDVADQALALSSSDESATGSPVAQALSNIGTFNADAFLGQLGYDKKKDIPDWVKSLKSGAVYDTGGWLPPGGVAVNLSSSPEPIFNSPKQLQDFAGSQLQPAQSGALTEQDLERYMRLRPVYNITTADVSGAVQQIRVEQRRQSMTYTRR
ncbi:tape measure protein [Nocardia brasiliensis]|uniref:tape measure protein n=1 Tax=Nocardia brasiliensis TaxID=37326 RepID=UPI00245780E4|nr:tape measure protein [Nocardia brasiliensis]